VTAPVRMAVLLRTFAAEDPGTWSHLVDLAVAADEAGVDRLVLSDHVAMGEELDAYGDPRRGGVTGGRQPTGPDGHWLEPLTVIAHLSAVTRRVRFGTSILLAALRRPVVLAKTVATIDVLSGGRLDLGVGVGWQRQEYEAAGLDFDARGRLLDQTLEVCLTLWREQAATYEGDGLSFHRVHQMPKPRQSGGVPVWVSGTVNPRSMRRLARFGSGWIPWGSDAADLAGAIGRMRAAVASEGRDPADLSVAGNLAPVRAAGGGLDLGATLAQVPALRDAGVTDLTVPLSVPADPGAAGEHLRGVVAAFREAAAR